MAVDHKLSMYVFSSLRERSPYMFAYTKVWLILILFAFSASAFAQASQGLPLGKEAVSDPVFGEARLSVQSMENDGFSVSTLKAALSRMDQALSAGDYGSARVAAEGIIAVSLDAGRAAASLRQAQGLIRRGESRWLAMDNARSLVGLSLAAMQREDYSVALDRAGQAVTAAEIESSRLGVRWVFAKFWWAWLFVCVLLVVSLLFGLRAKRAFFISRRIKALEAQDVKIMESIRDAYKRRYGTREISGSVFHKEMFHYLHRQREIREGLLQLRSRRASILGVGSELKELERERLAVEAMASKAQEAHLVKKRMTEQEYHPLAQEYQERLAEIDEAIGVLQEASSVSRVSVLDSNFLKGFKPAGRGRRS